MLRARRFFLFLLLAIFMAAPRPAGALAETKAISLEQAINIVKENFNVPDGFNIFSSGYENYEESKLGGTKCWTLNWDSSGDQGGSFNARVDAETGEIIGMQEWKPGSQAGTGFKVPAFTVAEARKIAEETVKKLAVAHLADLQPAPDDGQVIPLNNYDAAYTIRWQRIANGIPFPGEGVTVQVRADTGRVIGYNLNWTKSGIPSLPPTGIISPEKARQVFESADLLQKQYFLPQSASPFSASTKQPVMLIYRLRFNGAIDALSGKPLDRGESLMDPGIFYEGGYGGQDMNMKMKAPAELKPEEIKEIEATSELISQEEAVAAVKKWVDIPAGMVLQSTNLSSYWMSPDTYVWNLSWRSDKAGEGESQYVSASVDAKNGELMSFNSMPLIDSRKLSNLERAAAQKIAEDFLKRIQPQRFRETKLDNVSQFVSEKETANYPFWNFNYQRIANGIITPNNDMYISIDKATKRIVEYNLTWSSAKFPPPAGILDTTQAADCFLKKIPLTLLYAKVYEPSETADVRLVYKPVVRPGSAGSELLDAKTGQLLDWQGKPLVNNLKAGYFTDIKENFAENEINILGQAGLFKEYGDAFHPEEKMTVVSLLRAMLTIQNGPWGNPNFTDQELLKRAREMGWLKEDWQPGSNVDREKMAMLMVRFLRLEPAAKAEGIYQVPFADAGSLPSGSLGYVALSLGLEIIKGDGVVFDAGHVMSRAEAAAALARTLKVNNQPAGN